MRKLKARSAKQSSRSPSRMKGLGVRRSVVPRPTRRRVPQATRETRRLVSSRMDAALGPSREERRREARAFAFVAWMGMLILLFLSLSLLVLQSFVFFAGGKGETIVPNVVGIPYEEAALSVENAGLVLRIRSEMFTDDVEADRIIEQLPAAGARVKIGREVLVDVSKGPRTLTTPNLVGQKRESAIAQLQGMGLLYRLTSQPSDLAPEGTVVNQSPPPSSPIALGEIVQLVIAERPPLQNIQMPNLEGLPYEEALRTLEEYKLRLKQVSRIYEANAREVTVYTQFPLAGSQVREGSDVILTLSCPASYESTGQRSARVSISVPQSAGKVRVRIVVQDRYQTREVYSSEHTGPTTVQHLVTSYGRTTIKIYFDNKLVREETY